MSFSIRRAQIQDAPFIVDANCRMALETERLTLDRATVQMGVRAILEDPAKGLYFVATLDERPIGQLMITYEWSDWRNSNIWWVQSVYVLSEYRRKGAFTALYRHVEALAHQSGSAGLRLYVEENNRIAQQTYEQLGMHLCPYRVMGQVLHE